MKKKIVLRALVLLIITSTFACAPAKAQTSNPLMKATLPGYPVFVVTNSALMPVGATGGVVTLSKAADNNTDQKLTKDAKNKAKFATLDVVTYNAGGQKTKTIHFTNLVISSIVPNYQGVTAIGFTFDNMTQN